MQEKKEPSRTYRERIDPYGNLTENQFRQRYRLSSLQVELLADEFGQSQFASKGTRHSKGLTHRERVCLALRFLASGGLYTACGDGQGVNKSTVCRSVHAFVQFLNKIKDRYIRWPMRHEFARKALTFYKLKKFPKVIGAVDGTHIPIRNPTKDRSIYYNKKNFPSINVMVVVNADLTFSHVDARFPGSVNDAYVLKESQVSLCGEEGNYAGYVLVGDSGYPLRDYLFTPFINPATPEEHAYNAAHTITRFPVEQAIDILKKRFRCLDVNAGSLMCKPERCCLIVVACCVLHNMAIMDGEELDIPVSPTPIVEEDQPEEVEPPQLDSEAYQRGAVARQEIMEDFFTVQQSSDL